MKKIILLALVFNFLSLPNAKAETWSEMVAKSQERDRIRDKTKNEKRELEEKPRCEMLKGILTGSKTLSVQQLIAFELFKENCFRYREDLVKTFEIKTDGLNWIN